MKSTVLFLGLATPSNNTVLPASPLFRDAYQTAWTQFDPNLAGALLDELGLTERNDDGVRLLADGRPLEIVIETTGEDAAHADALELIYDTWFDVGVELFVRPVQREVFLNRVFAGETQMAIWFGADNGLPTANFSPEEFVPVQQIQLQWPKWGQYIETGGQAGEPIDLTLAEELLELNTAWRHAGDRAQRERIWHRILEIHADQLYIRSVSYAARCSRLSSLTDYAASPMTPSTHGSPAHISACICLIRSGSNQIARTRLRTHKSLEPTRRDVIHAPKLRECCDGRYVLAERGTVCAARAASADGYARQAESRRPPRYKRYHPCVEVRRTLGRCAVRLWPAQDALQ